MLNMCSIDINNVLKAHYNVCNGNAQQFARDFSHMMYNAAFKSEKYFKKKLAEEEVCLQQAKEERERSLQEFERSLAQLKSETEDVVNEFSTKYCRHQDKFQELEDILDRACIFSDQSVNSLKLFLDEFLNY
ncbi:hypothetical protein TNCV_4046191 [Trichonephila clavipes]|nr:hypothetical protein TNCV_4046191 [Trichonephila clavipes]